jgi:hypothetical protein
MVEDNSTHVVYMVPMRAAETIWNQAVRQSVNARIINALTLLFLVCRAPVRLSKANHHDLGRLAKQWEMAL